MVFFPVFLFSSPIFRFSTDSHPPEQLLINRAADLKGTDAENNRAQTRSGASVYLPPDVSLVAANAPSTNRFRLLPGKKIRVSL